MLSNNKKTNIKLRNPDAELSGKKIEFEEYLQEKKYSTSTIKNTIQVINQLENWFEDELQNLRYQDLAKYIETLQKRIQPQTINQRLVSIRMYFNYLLELGEVTQNPAKGVQVKNEKKKLKNVLSDEELGGLYSNFDGTLLHKIILGLVIYQAADAGALKRLKTEHINLEKGEVYFSSSRRSNARKLTLHTSQMLPLYKFIEVNQTEFLFQNHSVDDRLFRIVQLLKPKVESIRQIRSSVITNWLKKYNLREVQFLCGHRYISSTENYLTEDLEKLKNELKVFHPLG